jgi:hypothetical protein
MNNFPPIKLGRSFVMPCRDHGMNMFVALAEHPGRQTWKRIPLDAAPPFHRMDEPTLYMTGDGVAHLVIAMAAFRCCVDSTDRGHLVAPVPNTGCHEQELHRTAVERKAFPSTTTSKQRDPLAISTRDGWSLSPSGHSGPAGPPIRRPRQGQRHCAVSPCRRTPGLPG